MSGETRNFVKNRQKAIGRLLTEEASYTVEQTYASVPIPLRKLFDHMAVTCKL